MSGRRELATVRIVTWTPAGPRPTVGLGVLVGESQVVTCAHVVNAALGRDRRARTGRQRPLRSSLSSRSLTGRRSAQRTSSPGPPRQSKVSERAILPGSSWTSPRRLPLSR